LDDALDKLARRDELRRRTAGEATGTPPAVQELVEAIVTVVGRNPKLSVTVGVEGAGDPVLLHFGVEDGTVQVSVDNSVASRVAEAAPSSPRHADFDLDVEDDPAADPFESPVDASEAGQETRRISYDDRERYGYSADAAPEQPSRAYGDPLGGDRRYEGHRRYDDELDSPDFFAPEPAGPFPAESRARYSTGGPDTDPRGSYTNGGADTNPRGVYTTGGPEGVTRDVPYPPHPFAATPPPPVPPQISRPSHTEQHRARVEQHLAHDDRPDPDRGRPPEPARSMPTPLPEPIPLNIDSEETEQAARRLAALLRDNPTLLRPSSHD
jgi:hypothetical protein